MENYERFKNQIIKYHLFFSIIIISLFYSLNLPKYVNAYILGAFVSIISFILMAKTNEKIFFLRKNFTSYQRKWFILRYILIALVLVASLKKNYFNFAGAVIGIFSIQLTIFSSLILGKLRN